MNLDDLKLILDQNIDIGFILCVYCVLDVFVVLETCEL